jgi:hypothetical protein
MAGRLARRFPGRGNRLRTVRRMTLAAPSWASAGRERPGSAPRSRRATEAEMLGAGDPLGRGGRGGVPDRSPRPATPPSRGGPRQAPRLPRARDRRSGRSRGSHRGRRRGSTGGCSPRGGAGSTGKPASDRKTTSGGRRGGREEPCSTQSVGKACQRSCWYLVSVVMRLRCRLKFRTAGHCPGAMGVFRAASRVALSRQETGSTAEGDSASSTVECPEAVRVLRRPDRVGVVDGSRLGPVGASVKPQPPAVLPPVSVRGRVSLRRRDVFAARRGRRRGRS